jgi:hypothetical protein
MRRNGPDGTGLDDDPPILRQFGSSATYIWNCRGTTKYSIQQGWTFQIRGIRAKKFVSVSEYLRTAKVDGDWSVSGGHKKITLPKFEITTYEVEPSCHPICPVVIPHFFYLSFYGFGIFVCDMELGSLYQNRYKGPTYPFNVIRWFQTYTLIAAGAL